MSDFLNHKPLTILLFTDVYPYYPGEEFLNSELKHWVRIPNVKIIIFPSSSTKNIRKYSDKIVVSEIFASLNSCFDLRMVLCTTVSALFIKDICTCIKVRGFNLLALKSSFYSCYQTLAKKTKLRKFLADNNLSNILAYSYWTNTSLFAAILAIKTEKISAKVIARSHRYDLYENHLRSKYMPLIRNFSKYVNSIYFLSDNALMYAVSRYSIELDKCKVARLGVNCKKKLVNIAPFSNTLNFVSVSPCTPVKHVNKIISFIEYLSKKMPSYEFVWTHIGSGPLLGELMHNAKDKLLKRNNVTYEFKGYLENDEVLSFYEEKSQDFIINLSSSEGIPVSIMEAMSNGSIPIASDVGETNQIVNSYCGILLSADPTPEELIPQLKTLLEKPDKDILKLKKRCSDFIRQNFNQEENYQSFVKDVYDILI